MILFTKVSLVFFMIGLASMLSHAVKKWANGEIRGDILDWYLVRPQASVGALMACIGGIATAILSGALDNYTVGAQIIAAWGIGFSADTINNQDRRSVSRDIPEGK